MRPVLMGFLFGMVVGFVIGVLGFAAATFFSPPRGAKSPQATPAPAPATTPADVVLTLSESFLTRLLKQQAPDVASLDVRANGDLAVTADVPINVGPLRLKPRLTAITAVRVQEGRLSLTLSRVEAGPIGIPQQLIPQAASEQMKQWENDINHILDEPIPGQSFEVTALDFSNHAIAISLRAK